MNKELIYQVLAAFGLVMGSYGFAVSRDKPAPTELLPPPTAEVLGKQINELDMRVRKLEGVPFSPLLPNGNIGAKANDK